jgi:hypothetical protein
LIILGLIFACGMCILLKTASILGFWLVKRGLSTTLSTFIVDIGKTLEKSVT